MLFRPTTKTTPDAWARQNRIYPPSAAIPGPRDPGLTPYGIEFVRTAASAAYKRVVQVMAAQCGKTDGILDLIGHKLDQRPEPILYVGPNKQFLLEQFEPRVMALLDEAPTLRRKLARGKRMSKTRKLVAGVPVRLAHAGSSTALKSDPAALAITDELDELVANVKGQGDPVGLVDARGDTYGDGFCHVMVSTCSLGIKEVERDPANGLDLWKVQAPEDIESTIWRFWQQGTRHHWCWRCPGCGEWFVPRFDCLAFEGRGEELTTTPSIARATAVVICPANGCIIRNEEKAALNRGGRYVAPGQTIDENGNVVGDPPDSDTASFWVSGLCTPFKTFGDRAALYVEAVQSGNTERIRTVMNAGFGELWSPAAGEAPEWTDVWACRDVYVSGEVPAGVLFLTAGVDVQKRKLVFVIRGWGYRQESWLVSAGELHGDTKLDDAWLDLYALLTTEFPGGLMIRRAFVDSGFRPGDKDNGDENKVYEFCRRHSRLAFATKGYDRRPQPISVNRIDVLPSGGRPKYGLDLVRLDSDYLKRWVHERIHWPEGQPGGWHLPADITEDYCRQITNESRVRKPGGGYTWVPSGPRDYLDAEAMAYGAAKMLGVDRLINAPPPPPPEHAAREARADAAPPAAAPQPQPTVSMPPRPSGGWLGGRPQGWLRR